MEIGHRFKFKEWKRFTLDSADDAIRAYASKEKEGKIFITNE